MFYFQLGYNIQSTTKRKYKTSTQTEVFIGGEKRIEIHPSIEKIERKKMGSLIKLFLFT